MSNDVQYPYALDEQNNLISIEDIHRENRHDHSYHCPNCGHSMLPRLGNHNAHCFAHSENQKCGVESYIHVVAKRILTNRFNDRSRPFIVKFRTRCICKDNEICEGFTPSFCEKGLVDHSSIDKRVPKSEIEFEDDLKKFGALEYKEPSIEEKKQEIQEKIDSIIEAERENTDYLEKNQPNIQPPTVADLRKDEPEVYDATKVLTYAFRRKTDLRKEQPIPFGNMNGGFSFKLQGHTFLSSECAYIAGMFSDNKPEHIAIQEKLLVEKSGYSAKKEIRRKNESLAREDWYTFNVEWMLYVVWTKVKQNKKFRQLLMAVPDNAILIEDTTFQKGATSSFWGAKNSERKEFSKLVELKLDYENLDVSLEDEEVMRDALVNQVCNIGTYVGCNVMGKILTICRKCLADGTEPPIDYELLRSKHIHLLGKELTL